MNFQLVRQNVSIECVCLLAINLLNAVEEIHRHNIVHRNLKPRKILFDQNLEENQLYLIDFKFAKKFKHSKNQTIKYTETHRIHNKVFLNRFSSIGAHMGISNQCFFIFFSLPKHIVSFHPYLAPSFKDDLESIGYILIYLLR